MPVEIVVHDFCSRLIILKNSPKKETKTVSIDTWYGEGLYRFWFACWGTWAEIEEKKCLNYLSVASKQKLLIL